MIAVLLLQLSQGKLPTVGDTIWLTRRIRIASGQNVRAGVWAPSGAVELLGRAEVTRNGNEVAIRYPAVAWEPGEHALDVPGPVVLSADGHVDSLPPEHITIRVGSVLPPAPAESVISAQPQAGVVRMREVSARPLLILWTLAGILVLPIALLRRRRGPKTPVRPDHPDLAPPVESWAHSGETRAVTALAATRLREALAAGAPSALPGLDSAACLAAVSATRPDWPLDRIADMLGRLDQARFALTSSADAPALFAESDALTRELLEHRALVAAAPEAVQAAATP
ncbi:MAG: hypothetical protein ABJD11_07130 [Gemmatimonadota bacterium]